ncbi:MAG: hypothetical protein K2P93_02945 [Alphaproteobacteria bacterium]|nr:hypothetical protein [Alphaproteobacteria bacterium]
MMDFKNFGLFIAFASLVLTGEGFAHRKHSDVLKSSDGKSKIVQRAKTSQRVHYKKNRPTQQKRKSAALSKVKRKSLSTPSRRARSFSPSNKKTLISQRRARIKHPSSVQRKGSDTAQRRSILYKNAALTPTQKRKKPLLSTKKNITRKSTAMHSSQPGINNVNVLAKVGTKKASPQKVLVFPQTNTQIKSLEEVLAKNWRDLKKLTEEPALSRETTIYHKSVTYHKSKKSYFKAKFK